MISPLTYGIALEEDEIQFQKEHDIFGFVSKHFFLNFRLQADKRGLSRILKQARKIQNTIAWLI